MTRALHAVALVCLLGSGCDDGARSWIADVRADSEAAEAGDRGEAIEALERLLAREVPDGVAQEDARVVRQDAHERLAQLLLEAGDLERARRVVERGLLLGERDDVFTANLLTLRGRIFEAQGRDHEAAREYHRALRIHEALLDRALGR